MSRWVIGIIICLSAGLDAFAQVCPTVGVVIPETVIIRRIPRPIPDPAAETAIIKEFLDYGFNVVDLVHVRLLRATPEGLKETEDLARQAMAGDQIAIRKLAGLDGKVVDILVVGEAVSTVEVIEDMFPERLENGRARVEVRAIKVATGQILAAEAIHTGGMDFSPELAGKKSLEQAGKKIACQLARAIAQRYPLPKQCFKGCSSPACTMGVLPFENQSGVWIPGLDLGRLFATAVETALSEQGCATAQPFAGDYLVTGTITDWREIRTSYINLPVLDLVFRAIASWVTVDVRLLDPASAEFKGRSVTVNVTGVEIFGFRFGASPQDIARAAAREIAAWVCPVCKGR